MSSICTVTAHDFDIDVHTVVGTCLDYETAYELVKLYLLHEIEDEGVGVVRDTILESFSDEQCFILAYDNGEPYDDLVLAITTSPAGLCFDPGEFYRVCESIGELRKDGLGTESLRCSNKMNNTSCSQNSGDSPDQLFVLVALP